MHSLLSLKRFQQVCPKATIISPCVTSLNRTFYIDPLSFSWNVNLFPENNTGITDVFGKTTDLFVVEIDNNIMFRIQMIVSSFSGIKTIVDYMHNGPLKINASTKCGKAVVLSALVIYVNSALIGKFLFAWSLTFACADLHGIMVFLTIFSILIVFPGLLSIGPLSRVVGLKKYTRMILKHPELLVLPIVTEYVPGPIDGGKHYPACCHCCKFWRSCTWSCCCEGCEVVHTSKVVISKELSWTKMIFSSVFWMGRLYLATMTYINTNNGGKLIFESLGASLERVCFGITLHYCNLKFGVLVIGNMGDVRSALKQELDFELQKRLNSKV